MRPEITRSCRIENVAQEMFLNLIKHASKHSCSSVEAFDMFVS
jgi:hypothetical protein